MGLDTAVPACCRARFGLKGSVGCPASSPATATTGDDRTASGMAGGGLKDKQLQKSKRFQI